ncbi:DUF4238 domain-containing protein [Spirosoma sp. KCTC 42546]|uniref:DUF4238 domain-containing protein n=1 Tax=Spirosoma sp. KCTC 42546 TaxID=2520506 RepID=UPI001158875C|nr:DUF4238 domain-containing protein [Spirosoma sp. KCTC 42546]QDK81465.1 DUF4238 domain-containing protein [Spirosoma sp. KCTC 42546]
MAKKKGQSQHIVPKVYLEGFTKQNGKFFKLRIDLDKRPNPREFHPSQVCYRPDYYKFENNSFLTKYKINDLNILENYGFLYENTLGNIIEKISSAPCLSFEDVSILSEALLDIKLRNDYFRKSIYNTEHVGQVFDKVVEELIIAEDKINPLLQAGNITFDRFIEIKEKIKENIVPNASYQKDLHNSSILQNKIAHNSVRQDIINKITRANWIVLETTMNHQFITSDNPGFCMDSSSHIHNTKFGEDFAFFFPLNPYKTLLISSFVKEENSSHTSSVKNLKYILVNQDWVKGINQGIMHMAVREIYAAHEQSLLTTWYSINKPFLSI